MQGPEERSAHMVCPACGRTITVDIAVTASPLPDDHEQIQIGMVVHHISVNHVSQIVVFVPDVHVGRSHTVT